MEQGSRLESLRLSLLDEMRLPDFKGRHLFIAKLRLIIFFLCWILFIVFYPKIWGGVPLVPLIFNLGLLITAICYWNVLHEKHILRSIILEVSADVISQTTLIYLLGADSVVVFLFYGLYVVAAGSFFGYIMALLAATAALVSYCGLLALLQLGWIKSFIYPF